MKYFLFLFIFLSFIEIFWKNDFPKWCENKENWKNIGWFYQLKWWNDYQNSIIAYISCKEAHHWSWFVLDFLDTLLKENWDLDIFAESKTKDYWLCQINKKSHPETIKEKGFWTFKRQLEICTTWYIQDKSIFYWRKRKIDYKTKLYLVKFKDETKICRK